MVAAAPRPPTSRGGNQEFWLYPIWWTLVRLGIRGTGQFLRAREVVMGPLEGLSIPGSRSQRRKHHESTAVAVDSRYQFLFPL